MSRVNDTHLTLRLALRASEVWANTSRLWKRWWSFLCSTQKSLKGSRFSLPGKHECWIVVSVSYPSCCSPLQVEVILILLSAGAVCFMARLARGRLWSPERWLMSAVRGKEKCRSLWGRGPTASASGWENRRGSFDSFLIRWKYFAKVKSYLYSKVLTFINFVFVFLLQGIPDASINHLLRWNWRSGSSQVQSAGSDPQVSSAP